MTIEDIKASYNKTIETERLKLSDVKKKIFSIGTVRLLLIIACIVACIILWPDLQTIGFVIFSTIVIFLPLMKYHSKLFSEKKYIELLIQNAKDELCALDYDFSAFDGTPESIDANHSFSLDLDLFGKRSFFQSLNRTVSVFGKKQLTQNILAPLKDKNKIIAQQKIIKELSQKPQLINHFRAIGKMNELKEFKCEDFVKHFENSSSLSKSFWRIMPFVVPTSFVVLGILSYLGIIPIAAFIFCWTLMIIISLIPAKKIKTKLDLLDKKQEALSTYADLMLIIEKESFESVYLKDMQKDISTPQSAHSAVKELKKLGHNIYLSYTIVGVLLLCPFLAWNVNYAIKIEKWMSKYGHNMSKWFEIIGRFDSLVSQAMYAYNHPDYTYPHISDTYKLEGENLGHPMIHRDVCVRNDIHISRNPYFLVITGANMAGKSTYLRTVGINLVLAGMGLPVCATSFNFYPYQLVTNLRTSDSLNDNESYFFAELKRLKMIIDRLNSGEELFIILDEILKGTNSEDKQKGSLALMKQLVSLGGNGIIATHDLELGNLENDFPDAIKDYRFEADINGDNLSFSYKMKEGVAQNMNACFLMKRMGITGL